jgi:hypothetical protein
MKEVIASRFTPQRKAIGVNDKFGNRGIKNQQGTTRIIYDTLPIDGRTEFRFFEGSAQRNFPFSNTGSDGNKLGVGNTLVVERAYLSLVTTDEDTGAIKEVLALTLGAPGAAVSLSEFGFMVANSEVIKTVPVLSWFPEFNKVAENQLNTNFEFDTQIVIPPLLEFVATLRLAAALTKANTFLRLTIEGTGAIIAPRTTF